MFAIESGLPAPDQKSYVKVVLRFSCAHHGHIIIKDQLPNFYFLRITALKLVTKKKKILALFTFLFSQHVYISFPFAM